MQSRTIFVNRENFPKGVTRLAGVARALSLVQIALNCSNGCRQLWQNQIDLHAVEPNTLFSSVSGDLQYGQRAVVARRRSGISSSDSRGPGGAMPYASSFARADGGIQSVVHAGV